MFQISPGRSSCLFYSTCSRSNLIQSSNASNLWIASLRSNQPLFKSTGALPQTAEINCPPASNREWREQKQRLRHLAAKCSIKVKSLSERETSAAAEKWRYIQSVLEKRRQQSKSMRRRFIQQPLEELLQFRCRRISGPTETQCGERPPHPPILKQRSGSSIDNVSDNVGMVLAQDVSRGSDRAVWMAGQKWHYRLKESRRVRFAVQCFTNANGEETSDVSDTRLKLPTLFPNCGNDARPTESDGTSPWQPLPPLSCTPTLNADGGEGSNKPEPEPSWSERQVAKVKQRKTWSTQLPGAVLPHPYRLLKRSFSTVVNVSDESDSNNTEHLNESLVNLPEDFHNEQSNELKEEPNEDSADGKPLESDIKLHPDGGQGKTDVVDSSSEKEDQIVAQELALSSHYRGWPNFPRKMASSISTRQKLLKMRSVTSTEEAGPLVARQPQPKQHKEARNRRLVRRGKVSPMRPSAETAPPATQCRCVHKSILNCLLPAVFQDTLNDLEIIRRQLKATRLRRHKLPRPTGS